MRKPGSAGSLDCPFLRPVTVDHLWMYPTGVFCRLPSGRVRVPCPDTVTRTCTNGLYLDCSNYRRFRQPDTA